MTRVQKLFGALRGAPIAIWRWIDALWGYDVFIAHRRADAKDYARALYDTLKTERIAGFIDQVVYGAGDSLLVATNRHVSKSSVLLLVGSPKLLEPRETPDTVDWVEAEIETYLGAYTDDPKLIVVDIGDVVTRALGQASATGATPHVIAARIAPHIRLSQPADALHAPPTEDVLAAIRRSLLGRRRDRARLRFFQASAGVLALLFAAAVFFGVAAEQRRIEARAGLYGNAAFAYSDQDPTLAIRLVQASLADRANTAAQSALLRAFNRGSWLYSTRIDDARTAILSSDGSWLYWSKRDGSRYIRNQRTGMEQPWTHGEIFGFSSRGDAVARVDGVITVFAIDGTPQKTFGGTVVRLVACDPDTYLTYDGKPADHRLDAWPPLKALRVINAVTGDERTVSLPASYTPDAYPFPIRNLACTSGARTIVLATSRQVFVFHESGGVDERGIPEPFSPWDMTLSNDGRYVALSLGESNKRQGEATRYGLGIIAVGTPSKPLSVIALADSDAYRDRWVQFIDQRRIVVAEVQNEVFGNLARGHDTYIIDVESGARTQLPAAAQGAEFVAAVRSTEGFAIARRSGIVTIHDRVGFPVAQLVGIPPSRFDSLALAADHNQILTVTSSGIRVWRKPQLSLIESGKDGERRSNAFNAAFRPLDLSRRTSGELGVESCRTATGTEALQDVYIDDVGAIALCVKLGGRNILLPAGLNRREFLPVYDEKVSSGRTTVAWYSLADEKSEIYVRMFALRPNAVLDHVTRSEKVWDPGDYVLRQLIQ